MADQDAGFVETARLLGAVVERQERHRYSWDGDSGGKGALTIMLCLADDVITEVSDEETAAGLWLKLESLYMKKSLTNKLLLKQRLFGLRMDEGTQLREHL